MNQEPLKGKIHSDFGCKCSEDDFHHLTTDDVVAAVAWLKRKLKEWECFDGWEEHSKSEKKKLYNLIDEAFADVVEGKDGEGKTEEGI